MSCKDFSSETKKKIHWVKKMYDDWRAFRRTLPYVEFVDCDLDDDTVLSVSSLCHAIPRFISEVKKLDGSDFLPRTLKDIVLGIQFYLEMHGFSWKLIDHDNFKPIRFTLDNLMKARTQQGLGNVVRQAQVISFDEEELMWQMGILGYETLKQLVETLLYLLGISCALRAGKEHRSLRSIGFNSQFSYWMDANGNPMLQYREDIGLKTNKGGLCHSKVTLKIVPFYSSANRSRCVIELFFFYHSKLPVNRNALYLRPLANAKPGGVWFADRAIGINTLQKTVKDMCSRAGLTGFYSNHSLRATSATRMYNADVQEQVIQEVTGHRSLAVRSYKKTSVAQKRHASDVLFNSDLLRNQSVPLMNNPECFCQM